MGSDVYFFNPTAEMAIANGLHSYQPPGLLQTFEKDMAAIMLYFASSNDFVIVDVKPENDFLKSIQSFKPDLPTFLTLNDLEMSHKTLGQLIPWAWSPVIYKTFENVFPFFKFENSLWNSWKPENKLFFDRQTALKFIKDVYPEIPAIFQPDETIIPEVCMSIEEIDAKLKAYGSIVLKTPFSSSGRGLQMLRKNQLNASNIAWIESALESNRF